jgi:hypothetical protein
MRPRVSTIVALLLLVTLLVLTAYIYSPLHRHDPLSNQACSFCAFAHCVGLEAAGSLFVIDPPAVLLWRIADGAAPHAVTADRENRSGRAPPASSSPVC